MAENNAAKKGEKLHKELEAHNKKTEACDKQLEKLAGMSKKALQAAKKIDELWKS